MVSLRRNTKKHEEVVEECLNTNAVKKKSFLKKSLRKKKSEDIPPAYEEESPELTDSARERKEFLETVKHHHDESPSDPETTAKRKKFLKTFKSKPSLENAESKKKFSIRKLKLKKKKGENTGVKEMDIFDEEPAEREAESLSETKENDDVESTVDEERDAAPIDSDEDDNENVQTEQVSEKKENEDDDNDAACVEDDKFGVKVMEEAGSLFDGKNQLASPREHRAESENANSKFFDSITSKFKKKKHKSAETDNEHTDEPSEDEDLDMNGEQDKKTPSTDYDEPAKLTSHSEDIQDDSTRSKDEENVETDKNIAKSSSGTESKTLCMSLGRMNSDEDANDENNRAFSCGGINKNGEGEDSKFSCGVLKNEEPQVVNEIENETSLDDGNSKFCGTLDGPQQLNEALTNKTKLLCNALSKDDTEQDGQEDMIPLSGKKSSGKTNLAFGLCSTKQNEDAGDDSNMKQPSVLSSFFCCA